jgi:hypothetical protein
MAKDKIQGTDYNLRSVAKSLLDANNHPIAFAEQLKRYVYGKVPTGELLIVGKSPDEFGLPIDASLPLVIKQGTIEKVRLNHEIDLEDLAKLPIWLTEHPLAFDSITTQNSIVVVIDAVDEQDNAIIVPIHMEIEKSQISVHEISSAYGKRDLEYYLGKVAKAEGKFYVNERTNGWYTRTQLQLPEVILNRLYIDKSNINVSHKQAEKHPVEFKSGESVSNPGIALDYMLGEVNGVVLYAEIAAAKGEGDNYDKLKARIISQAQSEGIAIASLTFPYDNTESTKTPKACNLHAKASDAKAAAHPHKGAGAPVRQDRPKAM